MKLLLSLSLLFSVLTVQAFEIPRLKGAVNDYGGLLSSGAERQIESMLRNFRAKGGAQIVVLTVDSLENTPIEQASIEVTDKWKLGDAKKDDGVLLLISKKDRRMRIEVGQGLEGNLSDAYAKRIIDQVLTPLFREGDFTQGILLGVYQIGQYTNPEIKMATASRDWRNTRNRKRGFRISDLIIGIIFILFFIGGGRSRSPILAFMLGSALGGGRRGGFGGGRGGFGSFGGGGGGGFSGGGASGGW